MERIELFDKYIAGTLSKAEVAEFRTRLDSDEKFATDFKVYLISMKFQIGHGEIHAVDVPIL